MRIITTSLRKTGTGQPRSTGSLLEVRRTKGRKREKKRDFGERKRKKKALSVNYVLGHNNDDLHGRYSPGNVHWGKRDNGGMLTTPREEKSVKCFKGQREYDRKLQATRRHQSKKNSHH